MEWYRVADVGEIAAGRPKILTLGRKEIGVFCEHGRYFAVLNHCPHFGAPVCLGKVFGGAVMADEPGQQSYDASRLVLRCPWHRWEFDLETGRALTPITQRIKTYPVCVGNETPTNPEQDGTHAEGGVETFGVKLEAGGVWVSL